MSLVHSQPIREPDSYTGIKVEIWAEKWRCYAYIFFWTMCLFASLLSRFFVVERLADGPDPSLPLEMQGCGPFNRIDNGFGVGLGQGFDYFTQTHLQELFGFPNICTSWDYTPSREITGMYFPLFEYSFVAYVILDLLTTKLAYKRGELPHWFMGLSYIITFVSIVLGVWFRMIFIFIAYEQVKYHTAAFLGLQCALILVAFQNTFFILMTGRRGYLGWSKGGVRCFAWSYMIPLVAISSLKVYGTIYIVQNGVGSPLYTNEDLIEGVKTGKIIDWIWMFYNAVLPLFIAIARASYEDPITFEITLPKPVYEGSDGENEALL